MTNKNWYENNDFWQTWGPVLFSKQRLANTPEEVNKILALVKIPPKTRVLDLCCGVGRHSLELARRGFSVTGVDRTQSYLEQARQQAKQEGLSIEFVREDMRHSRRPDTFDLVINMFTSFGYFEDQEDDRKVARNIYDSLKPGGVLLMEMSGKEIVAREFREHDWHEIDGVYWLEERKVIDNWKQMLNRWIMFKDGKRYEHTVCSRMYSATELRAVLKEAGFQKMNVYGGLDGRPYDGMAARLVVAAYKE
jgi:SAM-dependent methyltransferase